METLQFLLRLLIITKCSEFSFWSFANSIITARATLLHGDERNHYGVDVNYCCNETLMDYVFVLAGDWNYCHPYLKKFLYNIFNYVRNCLTLKRKETPIKEI